MACLSGRRMYAVAYVGPREAARERRERDVYRGNRRRVSPARAVTRPQAQSFYFVEHRNTIDATAFARSQASSILFYSLGDSSPL